MPKGAARDAHGEAEVAQEAHPLGDGLHRWRELRLVAVLHADTVDEQGRVVAIVVFVGVADLSRREVVLHAFGHPFEGGAADDEGHLREAFHIAAQGVEGLGFVHLVQPDALLDGRLAAHHETRLWCDQRQRQVDVVLNHLVVELAVELFVPRVAILLHHDDLGVLALVFVVFVHRLTDKDGHQQNDGFQTNVDQNVLRLF